MSYRGRGGGRGGRGGGRGFGGRGGGRGGGGHGYHDQGPPEEVIEVGYFTHTCEDDIVCNTTVGKIPYFNAPIFFENKEQIGKIDEIFGGIKENGFSVKLSGDMKASSFKEGQKLYIDPAKLLPIERFLNPNGGRGRGRGRGGDRGARGGRGFGRGGGDRGGFRGGRGGGYHGGDRGGYGGFRGGDRGGRGGFRGGDRHSWGGSGDRRGGGGFRGGNDRGGFKRSYDNQSTPRNKKMKFDD